MTYTQADLEEGIRQLQEGAEQPQPTDTPSDLSTLFDQIFQMNVNLIRLRQIIIAASVSEEDEIQHCIEKLEAKLFQDQLTKAKEAGLDVPRLSALNAQLLARREEQLRDPAIQPEQDEDLER